MFSMDNSECIIIYHLFISWPDCHRPSILLSRSLCEHSVLIRSWHCSIFSLNNVFLYLAIFFWSLTSLILCIYLETWYSPVSCSILSCWSRLCSKMQVKVNIIFCRIYWSRWCPVTTLSLSSTYHDRKFFWSCPPEADLSFNFINSFVVVGWGVRPFKQQPIKNPSLGPMKFRTTIGKNFFWNPVFFYYERIDGV